MGIFSSKHESPRAGAKPAAKKKPPPKKEITPHERAILDLKNQRDKLHQYRKQLGRNIELEKELARTALAAGNRERALLILKKKKYQETLLERAEKQYDNIEELVNSVEFAAMQKEVFDRLKQGKEVLDAINREMPIEDVERLMEETKEAIDHQNQIADMLGGVLTAEDEDECMQELEAIMAAEEEGERAEVTTTEAQLGAAPAVPEHAPEIAAPVEEERPQRERKAELVAA